MEKSMFEFSKEYVGANPGVKFDELFDIVVKEFEITPSQKKAKKGKLYNDINLSGEFTAIPKTYELEVK